MKKMGGDNIKILLGKNEVRHFHNMRRGPAGTDAVAMAVGGGSWRCWARAAVVEQASEGVT